MRKAFSFSFKKRFLLLPGFLIAFLIVFNASTYTLYKNAKSHLDDELGERLRSIAVSLAHMVELASPDTLSADRITTSLYTLLYTVKAENLLSNVVILSNDGKTVADLGHFSNPGEPNPFIELDFSAVTLARSGLPSYTGLYRSGDVYMKSAYAPITTSEEDVIGIVGVEAGAAFFDVLRALRRAIIIVELASFVVIIGLGILFYRQSASLDRAHEAVIKGENLAATGRMVASIAHEIRNPLSIIRTSAEHLQKKHGIQDEVLSYILEEVDQLNRILTSYLDFARAEDKDFRETLLQRIIQRCLLILDPEFKKKAIDLVLKLPEEEVIVRGNDKRLQQAILNVLLNSLQAIEEDGRIEISLAAEGSDALVLISDNGHGIDKKDLKEVTKPFFTRKTQGSGLGLSIVSNIVQEHRGSLDIQSSPDRGTKVSISIPRLSVTPENAQERKA